MLIDQLVETLDAKFQDLIAPRRGGQPAAKPLAMAAEAGHVIEIATPIVVSGVVSRKPFVAICRSIGVALVEQYSDLEIHKYDVEKQVHFGVVVLEVFAKVGLVKQELRSENGKEPSYFLMAEDEDGLAELWTVGGKDNGPSLEPYEDWHSCVHENGLPLVKKVPMSQLRKLHPARQPIVFDAINKMQQTGWKINSEILPVYTRAANNIRNSRAVIDGKEVSCFSYTYEENKKAKKSKRLETLTIKKMANELKNDVFYHQYACDFRGRVYPSTAFLHEQGSDNAKGLLLLSEGQALGPNGLAWLCMHATNSWGEDKLPLDDRAQFAIDHQEEWIGYANDPFGKRGWMAADKPWAFLACCFELKAIAEFDGDVADYVCHMPVFIDGSNNGVQHMTALARDEIVAPLVNLVPQDTPGDVYMYIAEKVWPQIKDLVDESHRDAFEEFKAAQMDLKIEAEGLQMYVEEVREEWKTRYDALKDSYTLEQHQAFAYLFWADVIDVKKQRKTCKRPVMTLGYGGTRNGFCTQVREDTAEIGPEFKYMDFRWSVTMGGAIYDTCQSELPGAAAMLKLFKDLCDRAIKTPSDRFGWTVPTTNFPVLQTYMKTSEKRIRVKFCGEQFRLTVQIYSRNEVSKREQKTGAAPNVIHSFDAAHLQMVVAGRDYATPTVHDSFGCLPGNMDDYFLHVREQFAEFHKADPLAEMLESQDSMDLMPERGDLDLDAVVLSDFAFA